ncbi:hypothetical protein YC2023_099738 [Brassica napus]
MEPAFKDYISGNLRRGEGQRLCSDYYDEDRETRRLSDGRRGRRFEELERQRETFSRRWLKLSGINEFYGDADWQKQQQKETTYNNNEKTIRKTRFRLRKQELEERPLGKHLKGLVGERNTHDQEFQVKTLVNI